MATILVVDDEPNIQELAKLYLEKGVEFAGKLPAGDIQDPGKTNIIT